MGQPLAPDPAHAPAGAWFETGADRVVNVIREGHWVELVERIFACPGFRLPTKPATGVGIERGPRGGVAVRDGYPVPGLTGSQSPLPNYPEGLPEEDGMFEPEGSSDRGQALITGWALFEEPGCRLGQPPREGGGLLSWLAEPLFEQCGGCHILAFRELKVQGEADRAR